MTQFPTRRQADSFEVNEPTVLSVVTDSRRHRNLSAAGDSIDNPPEHNHQTEGHRYTAVREEMAGRAIR